MKRNIVFLIGAFVLVAIIVFASGFSFNNKDELSAQNPNVDLSTNSPGEGTKTPQVTTTPTPVTPQPTPKPKPTPTPMPTPIDTTPGYTLAQVKVHASASDCWSIVGGEVYNLTPWINQHPGGSGAILSMCGKDATFAYSGQHGGQRRPANELSGFAIGAYKK